MARCIIFNPAAGRGLARRRIHQLRKCAQPTDEFRPTSEPGHAEELGKHAALQGFEQVIAAGGDGTVHEVANGVLQSGSSTVTFAPWPIGSANDYAFALGLTNDWPLRTDLEFSPRLVDAGEIVVLNRKRYFVNGLGLGFNAAVTMESRTIPRLRGLALYGMAFIKAVWRRYRFYNLNCQIDQQNNSQSTLALTVNLGPREGGFLVTPQAKLDDGWFDVVQAGPLSRWKALTLLPHLAKGTLPVNQSLIQQLRCQSVVIRSAQSLPIHLDGELFCIDVDDVREIRIDLLPKALRVLTTQKSPYFVS